MRTLVVGAGPAGLGLALEQARAGADVTVVEQRLPGEDPGWGVTLRDRAFDAVGLGDMEGGVALKGRRLVMDGEIAVDLPNPAAGHLVTMARATFLGHMRERCEAAGVRFRFGVDGASLPDDVLDRYDLVVGADGVHSAIRNRFADAFRPTIGRGESWFAWLGTPALFDKLTVLVRTGDLPLLGWAYRYAPDRSTLIVEVTDPTFHAHIENRPHREVVERLEVELAAELGGEPILMDAGMRWRRFPMLACATTVWRNVVLLGDAAHTAHYSQGFGTLLALDDAVTLATTLREAPDIQTALARYQGIQGPKIREHQETCTTSMRWAEAMARAASVADRRGLDALIAKRWPDNAVTAGPLEERMVPTANVPRPRTPVTAG